MGQRNIFDGLVLPPVRVLFYVLKTLLKLWLPTLIKASPPPKFFKVNKDAEWLPVGQDT